MWPSVWKPAEACCRGRSAARATFVTGLGGDKDGRDLACWVGWPPRVCGSTEAPTRSPRSPGAGSSSEPGDQAVTAPVVSVLCPWPLDPAVTPGSPGKAVCSLNTRFSSPCQMQTQAGTGNSGDHARRAPAAQAEPPVTGTQGWQGTMRVEGAVGASVPQSITRTRGASQWWRHSCHDLRRDRSGGSQGCGPSGSQSKLLHA